MKNKIIKILILVLYMLFFLIVIKKSYAKYIFSDDMEMNILIDKTPPNVEINYYLKNEISEKILNSNFLKNFICYCDNDANECNTNNIIDEQNDVEEDNELIVNNIINDDNVTNESDNVNEISEYQENCEENKTNENVEKPILKLTSASYTVGAGNETEFYTNFYNSNVSEITTNTNIYLSSVYTMNHSLKITSGGNALQLSSDACIVIPNGCVLTLDEVVIDGRQFRK